MTHPMKQQTRSPLLRGRRIFLAPLLVLAVALLSPSPAHAQGTFLFDATKAEMAGNADWVVDADLHNLNVTNGNGSGTTGTGGRRLQTRSASLPPPPPALPLQPRKPTGLGRCPPGASDWSKTASAWKLCLTMARSPTGTPPTCRTCPTTKSSAWMNPTSSSHPPKKIALLSFVQNGGGLMMVSDHTGSDRNNDGADAVQVWNDFFTNNGVKTNPIGITFNSDDVTVTSTNVDTTTSDPITHGASGSVSGFRLR